MLASSVSSATLTHVGVIGTTSILELSVGSVHLNNQCTLPVSVFFCCAFAVYADHHITDPVSCISVNKPSLFINLGKTLDIK